MKREYFNIIRTLQECEEYATYAAMNANYCDNQTACNVPNDEYQARMKMANGQLYDLLEKANELRYLLQEWNRIFMSGQ